jgi:type IV secretory pathway VirB10-like protein
MQARYLFNQGLYTDSEERRTQLFEESSQLILNLDAAIPFVPKAPKEERPPISVEVSPKIEPRIYMPRRRIKKAKAPTVEPKPEEENPAAVKAPEEPEEKIKRQIENGRLGLKAWKLRETRKRLKEFQEKSQEEAEARKLELGIKREEALAKSAATREAARRALSE